MVNRSRKGASKEKLCADSLVKEGFEILFKSQRVMFGRIDFGPFDIVAARRRPLQGPEWIFVAVTHRGAKSMVQEHKTIQEFAIRFAIDIKDGSMRFESWVWNPPGWRGRGKNKRFERGHFDISRLW